MGRSDPKIPLSRRPNIVTYSVLREATATSKAYHEPVVVDRNDRSRGAGKGLLNALHEGVYVFLSLVEPGEY